MSSDQKKVLPKLVPGKHLCCGCGACATVCPKKTIAMVANNEGFLFSAGGRGFECALLHV